MIEEFPSLLGKLFSDESCYNPKIIVSDFNALSEKWGNRETNERGCVLLEAFSCLNIVLANTLCVNTFQRKGMRSVMNNTFVSDTLANDIQWHLCQSYTQRGPAIVFCITLEGNANEKASRIGEKLRRACDAYWFPEASTKLLVVPSNRRIPQDLPQGQKTQSMKQKPIWIRVATRTIQQRGTEKIAVKVNTSSGRARKLIRNPGTVFTKKKIIMNNIKGKHSPPINCPSLLHRIVMNPFSQNVNTHSLPIVQVDPAEIPILSEERPKDMQRK